MLQVRAIRAALPILILGLCFVGYGQIVNSGGSAGGGGSVTSVTIAGTANQITATGTCTGTATITCTLSIPSAFVLPGTIDGLTITTTTGTLTVANGKTLTVNKTLTLDGTDGVTLTFPATSATIARTDAGQTFTGTQVLTATLGSTSTATTQSAGDNSTKLATTAYVDRTISRARIAQTILSGTAASVTFSAIPQTYTNLILTVVARGDTASLSTAVQLQFNGDTGNNYTQDFLLEQGGATVPGQGNSQSNAFIGNASAASTAANIPGVIHAEIPGYAATVFVKAVQSQSTLSTGAALVTNQRQIGVLGAFWNNTAAITSITILSGTGNFITGSTFTLYGEL